MKLTPLYDRLLIKREDAEDRTPGGIVIPDASKGKPQKGVVLAVGDGRILPDGSLAPLKVKQGDTILFGKYSGAEIEVQGRTYLIIREEDVLGVIGDVDSGVRILQE